MDAITKDSKEWRAALALVPEKGRLLAMGSFPVNDNSIKALPPPDITPDLLYAILEVMVKKYRTMQAIDWEMNFEGRSFRDAIIRAAASLQEK